MSATPPSDGSERLPEEAIASSWLWMDGRKTPRTLRELGQLILGDLRAQGFDVVPLASQKTACEASDG